MLIIARAALLPYDEGTAGAMPPAVFTPDDEEGLYFSQVAEKILASDGSRRTRPTAGSTEEAVLAGFARRPFPEACADLMLLMDENLRTQEAPADGFDLAVFSFETEGDPHLCVCRLMWRSTLLHRDEADEDGNLLARLGRSRRGMPTPGGKECAGFVINLSSGEICLRDVNVQAMGESKPLFGSVLFSLEQTRSEKATVQAVRELLRESAPAEMTAPEIEPAIVRAMAHSIEESGTLNVEEVAREVFAEEPRREEIVSHVAERIREEELAPVIPVENKKVARSLQRLKLRTDTGVAITLPQEMTEDAAHFSVINNPDGTISIFIGNISELRTE